MRYKKGYSLVDVICEAAGIREWALYVNAKLLRENEKLYREKAKLTK